MSSVAPTTSAEECRARSCGERARRADVASGDRRPEAHRAAPAASEHTRPGRRDCRRRACRREHEGEQGGADHAGPGHRQQVVDPGKSPELPWQPERQSCEQQCHRAGRGSHGGCSQPPTGSAIARASGTANAAKTASIATFRAIRTGGRADIGWPIAHPATASQMPAGGLISIRGLVGGRRTPATLPRANGERVRLSVVADFLSSRPRRRPGEGRGNQISIPLCTVMEIARMPSGPSRGACAQSPSECVTGWRLLRSSTPLALYPRRRLVGRVVG